MAEPEDLLSKADALMARHLPGRARSESYPDIPVLNEVVELPPESDDLAVPTERVESEILHADPALMASLRASLLAKLQPEIDALIDERVQASLTPLVDRLIGELCGELQLIARDALIDAIDAAIEREIERRKLDG